MRGKLASVSPRIRLFGRELAGRFASRQRMLLRFSDVTMSALANFVPRMQGSSTSKLWEFVSFECNARRLLHLVTVLVNVSAAPGLVT